MSRAVYIFVNGIRYDTGHDGWCDAAATWIINRTPHRALLYEYECKALTRWIGQGKRAKELAARIDGISPSDAVHLVGHSNGCDVICRALKQVRRVVDSAHLVAAATWPSFDRNGLNSAFDSGTLRACYLYCSPDDEWLGLPAGLSRACTFGLLGYGDLGRVGPEDMNEAAMLRTETRWHPGYRHADYFGKNFDQTMTLVTR